MLRVIFFVLLIAAGVAAYNMYQAANSAPANPAVATSPQAAASFDNKVDTVAKAAATPGKRPVHLVLTESEITSKVQQMVSSGKAGNLQNVQVKLGNGLATISGTTDLSGFSVPIEATARLGAARGLLTVDVTSIKAENVDLPAPLRDQLTQQVRQATGLSDLQNIDVGIDVTSVRVEPGQVQIDGETR